MDNRLNTPWIALRPGIGVGVPFWRAGQGLVRTSRAPGFSASPRISWRRAATTQPPSHPNVGTSRRPPEESANDQYSQNHGTRLWIDTQQALRLRHRHAEARHFGILSLNSRRQLSNRFGFGLVHVHSASARHPPAAAQSRNRVRLEV
jgi:hypothetical protein